jgi:hypothetical protein
LCGAPVRLIFVVHTFAVRRSADTRDLRT